MNPANRMNPSYLNGPVHELAKRLRPTKEMIIKLVQWDHFPSLREGILILRGVYWAIRYYWSTRGGPVFIVKLWLWILDIFSEDFTLLIKIQFIGVPIMRLLYQKSKI